MNICDYIIENNIPHSIKQGKVVQNGDLYLQDNQITSLDGFVQNGDLNLKNNQITSLDDRQTRPIVINKYTGNQWKVDGKEIVTLCHTRIAKLTDLPNADDNARLIAQAPKMHQICEAFFDMINGTDSIYLPLVTQVLKDINP